MTSQHPLVAVLMGSTSDAGAVAGCMEVLDRLGISHEVKVLSAHRTPHQVREYALGARARGIEVIIAAAGWAAHLAGFVAGHTTLPVIGIPIDSSPLQGLDALLSTVQMPPGIPVATVSIGKGGARNAAVLAGQILALKYPTIEAAVRGYREEITREAEEKMDSLSSGK